MVEIVDAAVQLVRRAYWKPLVVYLCYALLSTKLWLTYGPPTTTLTPYVLVSATDVLGLILFIVPGVAYFVRASVSEEAFLFEGLGAIPAFRRSLHLTGGRLRPITLLY
jgi:hypothetical protein